LRQPFCGVVSPLQITDEHAFAPGGQLTVLIVSRFESTDSPRWERGATAGPESKQVTVNETCAHDDDGGFQSRIHEEGDEDHAENNYCMVSDVLREVARGKGREKSRKKQDEARHARLQKSLNKRIVDTGRQQLHHAVSCDKSRVGKKREIRHVGKLISPSDRFFPVPNPDAVRVNGGRHRVRDERKSNTGIRTC